MESSDQERLLSYQKLFLLLPIVSLGSSLKLFALQAFILYTVPSNSSFLGEVWCFVTSFEQCVKKWELSVLTAQV